MIPLDLQSPSRRTARTAAHAMAATDRRLRILLAGAVCLLLCLAPGAVRAQTSDQMQRMAADLVEGWRAAWEAGDINAYIAWYDDDFRSRGMDLAAWRRYKAAVFGRSGSTRLEIGVLDIYAEGPRVRVSFDQRYESELLTDYGRKTLFLELTAAGLRIAGESWEPLPDPGAPSPPPLSPEPEVPFEPLVADRPDENRAARKPAVEPPPAPGPRVEKPLPAFEPVVAERADEDWTQPRVTRPDLQLQPSTATAVPVRLEVIEEIVAKVNDAVITKSELEEREREEGKIEQLYLDYQGDELQQELIEYRLGIIEDMVNELVLLQRAEDLHVNIESYVRRYLDDVKAENHWTSDADLERELESQGLTLAEFKERIRRRKIPQRLVYEEVTSRIEVSEADVREYYDKHIDEFRRAEAVEVREIVLLREENEDDDAVSRAADEIHRRLTNGVSFEQLARLVSETPSAENGGYLGVFVREDMSPELADVAFSLREGEISVPIRTLHGYHILKVERRIEPEVVPFEEVEDEIFNIIREERWQVKLAEYLDQLYRTNIIQINETYQRPEAGPIGPALRASGGEPR